MVYLKSHNQVALSGSQPAATALKDRIEGELPEPDQRCPQQPLARNRELSIDDRFATRLALDNAATDRMGFGNLLSANEQAARYAFENTIQSVPRSALPLPLCRNLNKQVFPKLKQIGLDHHLAMDLFRLCGQAWQLLNPYLEQQVAFHPRMVLEIKTIYDEVSQMAATTAGPEVDITRSSLRRKGNEIERFMAPENLHGLLENIPTPWIILPRAYRGLQKDECRYLPIYLMFIDKNGAADGNRLLARMVIELVANYSIKFTDTPQSLNLLKNAVFHAYEAMFWRTLRCPPSGFEDCRLFDTLFAFLKRHARKWEPTSPAMTKAVVRMQTARRLLFPKLQHPPAEWSPSRFIITLRHGQREMNSLLQYFENLPRLHRRMDSGRQDDLVLLKSTSEFISEVKKKYRHENSHTQQNVMDFLDRLRRLHTGRTVLKSTSDKIMVDTNRFSSLKLVKMIDELRLELFALPV